MRTWIALFRGINIAGNNPLPMRDLVRILERMGCKDVRTYIQSGNAVFRTAKGQPKKLAEEISSRIFKDHGFRPKVLLLSVPELGVAIEKQSFQHGGRKGAAFHVPGKQTEET